MIHFSKGNPKALAGSQQGKTDAEASAAGCPCRIANTSRGISARLSIVYCPLHLSAPELADALKAVTPPHRPRGRCWCSVGHDIDLYGHEGSCQMAQRALYKACESTARTTPGTAPVENVTKPKESL